MNIVQCRTQVFILSTEHRLHNDADAVYQGVVVKNFWKRNTFCTKFRIYTKKHKKVFRNFSSTRRTTF